MLLSIGILLIGLGVLLLRTAIHNTSIKNIGDIYTAAANVIL